MEGLRRLRVVGEQALDEGGDDRVGVVHGVATVPYLATDRATN